MSSVKRYSIENSCQSKFAMSSDFFADDVVEWWMLALGRGGLAIARGPFLR